MTKLLQWFIEFLFLSFDIGLVDDITGVSAVYYNGETMIGNTSLPKFKYPFVFGVSRKSGQATSLNHLYQFIKDLKNYGFNISFSADSFSSAELFQNLERDGIEYKSISVDRSMDAGIMFKNIVNTDRAELPRVERLLREASEIRIVRTGKDNNHIKLDHPTVSTNTTFREPSIKPGDTVKGSKDLFDSICACTFNCYQKYAEYKEDGPGAGVMKSMQALEHVTRDPREESAKVFQNMLENIF